MKVVLRAALMAAILVVCALPVRAGNGFVVQPASKVWLTGNSTVHAYHSNATKVGLTFQSAELPAAASPAEAMEQLIRGRGVTGLELTLAVAGMRSGKDGLDKNMSKALLAEKHPEIRFTMTGYEVAAGEAGAMKIDARGKLRVAGVEREIRIPVAAKREGDGLRLTGEVPLLMTQFGIKPPTMMMGAIKTSDEIVIHFDLVVGAGSAATAKAVGAGE